MLTINAIPRRTHASSVLAFPKTCAYACALQKFPSSRVASLKHWTWLAIISICGILLVFLYQ